MSNADKIEEMIQEKGLTAPRLTPDMIKSTIDKEQYVYPEGTTLTICILTLLNGFTVTGESNCASPENYNKDVGDTVAMDNAIEKIWPLEGYLLKQKLHDDRFAMNGEDGTDDEYHSWCPKGKFDNGNTEVKGEG